MFRNTLALLAAGLLAAPALAGELSLGDPAPKLDVQWVKGDPVASLDKGVYVVEFWATWCGPCKKSIPHLSELQHKYAGKATFVGVSVWEEDQANVAPFVEKMGDKMAYRVAMDRMDGEKGVMATTWMTAAQLKGIPSAFLVQDGKIAWIGHPQELEEPLEQVLAGTWDIAAAKQRMERSAKGQKLYIAVQEAAQKGEWQEALNKLDELVAADPSMELYTGPTRFLALLSLGQKDKASAFGRAFVAGIAKDNAQVLNALAWMIVDPEGGIESPDLELALSAATRANELTDSTEPGILDTLAKVYFDMGQVEKAIELQKKAVELAKGTGWEMELTRRLEEYQGAAKS